MRTGNRPSDPLSGVVNVGNSTSIFTTFSNRDLIDLSGKAFWKAYHFPGLKGILAPDETLLGEIISIDGDEAGITTNDGVVYRRLESLRLQRTREQIGDFIAFKLGKQKATHLFENLFEDRKARDRPSFVYSEASKFASWFSEDKAHPRRYENDDGFCFTVTMNNRFEGASILLHRTSLIFDYGPGASETTPFAGLSKFGPF